MMVTSNRSSRMNNENEITPEARSILDRLVKAGWLENVCDTPSSPNKRLLWYVNPSNPADSGYPRFLAFYKLYSELRKAGPLTSEDLLFLEAFAKSVLEGNRDNPNN